MVFSSYSSRWPSLVKKNFDTRIRSKMDITRFRAVRLSLPGEHYTRRTEDRNDNPSNISCWNGRVVSRVHAGRWRPGFKLFRTTTTTTIPRPPPHDPHPHPIVMDVNIDCRCEYLLLFVLCQNVMYYCTALRAVFDWICALQVFIIITFKKKVNERVYLLILFCFVVIRAGFRGARCSSNRWLTHPRSLPHRGPSARALQEMSCCWQATIRRRPCTATESLCWCSVIPVLIRYT